ncbi:hypothetical protein [Paracoccus spongiarum]|uniref:DUF2970 domain-containing protein n=1 Tax=Paracoccus spongiarum TaxID=3064387 RepID=A0ABT9JCN2_9RHOB|nr:hypothetical protein [Paracoccus sp. 2205BS29-5]MDP5307475.1 hypothetical protein [Paracoccus sp. 2205BS29-5]
MSTRPGGEGPLRQMLHRLKEAIIGREVEDEQWSLDREHYPNGIWIAVLVVVSAAVVVALVLSLAMSALGI